MQRARAAITCVLVTGLLAGGAQAAASMARGAGAELPAIAYQAWCAKSQLCTYRIADSSGIGDLKTGRATWVGEDEELPPSEVKKAGGDVAYYPTMLSGIAVATNIPATEGHNLDLTGAVIGDIFSGVITNWNSPRIRATNRRHHMPKSMKITLCVPGGASGESWDFSEFLSKVSPAFKSRVGGSSLRPTWKGAAIIRTKHVSQTGECMAAHQGAITFLPVADAMREGLMHDVVAVGKREKGKSVFMHPTEAAIQKAGHHAGRRAKGDLTVDLTNSAAPGAYPITIEAYAIVRKNKKMSAATRKTLAYFMSSEAQGMLQGLGYAPVPTSLLNKGKAQLAAAK